MKIQTLERLKRLPVGDKMTAYVGNLEQDMARCNPKSSSDKGAPCYKALLYSLWDELQRLATIGEIKVDKVERPGSVPTTRVRLRTGPNSFTR